MRPGRPIRRTPLPPRAEYLKRGKPPRRRGRPRFKTGRELAYLRWIRRQRCVITGLRHGQIRLSVDAIATKTRSRIGGATRLELERSLGLKTQTLCARLWELEGGKLLDGRRQWTARIQKTAAVRDGCHVYVAINFEGR